MSTIFLRLNGLPNPDPVRVPLLERRLACAAAPCAESDWRAAAWATVAAAGADGAMPAVAAAALFADRGRVEAGAVYLATPVHCEAGMVSVRLPPNGVLELAPAAASGLADLFNAEFAASGPRLLADPRGWLYCLLPQVTTAVTQDPQRVRGRDIGDYLPAGPDGARLRRLSAEIEMWLHDHALNSARRAAGELPVTGLWLWGGGEPVAVLPALSGWTAGDDPLFGAWPRNTAWPHPPGAGVIVVDAEPGGAGWAAAEATWLRPAFAALDLGRIGRLELSLGDQRYCLDRMQRLRFWRQARPWWEALG